MFVPFYIPANIKICGVWSVTTVLFEIAVILPFAAIVIVGITVELPYAPAVVVIPVTSVFATAKAELAYEPAAAEVLAEAKAPLA
jgi:hypothetical protein